mgnify:FL=1
MKYFSSDLHLNHANIIKYCSRPCTPENHNEWIYSLFDHLQEGDELYLLGDLMFKPTLQMIKDFFQFFKDKGVTLYIVLGNHDEPYLSMLYEAYRLVFNKSGIQYIHHYISLRYRNDDSTPFPKLIMSHYPMESWDSSYHGSVMLHGHTHGTSRQHRNRFDVGIDVEHKVYSMSDIIQKYNSQSEEPFNAS